MAKTTNITVSGLGGQGVLKVTDILAEVLFRAGYDGEEVASPMVPEGESDFLIVLEPTQIEVNLHKLKAGGVLITTDDVPTDRLKTPKALNTMMLGALSAKMPDIGEELFLEVLKAFLPEKLHELNIEMFRLGRQG